MIVTALRIIEREEKGDRDFLQRQRTTGFLPPGEHSLPILSYLLHRGHSNYYGGGGPKIGQKVVGFTLVTP